MNNVADLGEVEMSFPTGGETLTAGFREYDWRTTPIGPVEHWPQSLRAAVNLMLGTGHAMCLAWGPELTFFYNDAYAPFLGERHPQALGRPLKEVWADVWPDIAPLVERTLAGESIWLDELHLVMTRNGCSRDTWWTFSYSPLRDDDGQIVGFIDICNDVTGKVLAERRLTAERDRSQGVLDGMAEGFGLLDREFRILDINTEALKLETSPREAYIGRSHWEAFPGSEEIEVGRTLKRAMAERVAVSLEHLYRWEDAREAWLDMRAYPVGEGLAVFWRDVTDRKIATRKLAESEARQRFRAELGDALRPLTSPAEIMAVVAERLGRHLATDLATFYLIEGDEFIIAQEWTSGDRPSLIGRHSLAAFGDEATRLSWANQVLRIADSGGLEEAATFAAAGMVAVLSAPLHRSGRWVAGLHIHQLSRRDWTDEEEALVRETGERAWAAIERARAEELRAAQNRVLELAVTGATLTETLEELMRAVEAQSPTRALGSVLLLDKQGRHLLHGGGPSLPDAYNAAIHGLAIGEGVGSCGTAAHRRAPVYVSDVMTDPLWANFRDLAAEHGLRACWSTPILSRGGEVLGTFAMYYREPRSPVEADLELVDFVTRSAALAIERDRAETALRELNADLERKVTERALARGRTWTVSPELLGVVNADGYFEQSNPAWRTVLGWSEEEVASTLLFDLIHPDDLPRTQAVWEELKRGLPAPRFENRYRTKAGGWRWLSWVAVPDDGKVYCSARDVTAEKASADELARANEERDSAWAQSQDLLAIAERNGTLAAVNPAWTTLLGWTQEELTGRSFIELTHPDDLEATLATFAGIFDTPLTTAYEYRLRHKEGHYCWFAWTGSFRDNLVYASGRDTTAQHRQADALAAAEDALRQSQKLEAIGQLTGGVAHDFNNLLTVIRGSVDLLRRDNLSDEKRTRYIDAIGDTADRAAKLTGQLLAFARRQSLSQDLFDAGSSLTEVAGMLRTMTGSRVTLDLQVPDEPYFILADRSQFDTAVVNMGINARDAMDGEGRLTISTGPVSGIPAIRGHAAVPGEFVAVTIADTGSGIPSDQIDRIFEPFFTTKGVGQGTGLGLSQVIGFAKQSGGDIRVDSEPGRGTTFTLYLPRARPDAEAEPLDEREPERVDGDGVCVLVVEDNEQVGRFATAALKELGYDCILATDAEAALAALAAGCDRFHVVFSDVVMPGMSGVDLGEEVRRLHPDVPVILTSGYSHVLAQNGRHGFELLHKPYSVEQLSRVLRKAIAWQTARKPQS